MRVLVSGSNGMIGTALVRRLSSAGHDVVPLVRSAGASLGGAVKWDPASGRLDPDALGPIDAVVHLAGAGIGDHRWSDAHKRRVLESRITGTSLLAATLASLPTPPAVLASASAVGYYGDRGDAVISEESGPGEGFLAGVCRAWELATAPAEAAGIRVVHLRSGIVLSAGGGALAKQLPIFRLGLGGRLGRGRQYTSWISLTDEVGAITFVLGCGDLRGPVNLTAPWPVTNAEFTKALGSALHRPTVLAVPAAALSFVLGREMAAEMLLSGARVVPARLQAAGYAFAHRTLPEALAAALNQGT
jgi:uncharacterized protein (TIGR01777 family)